MVSKHITRFFVVALAIVSVAAVLNAKANNNPRKGRALFKKNCRVCHDGKTDGTPMLQPAELIIKQWERAFTDKEDVAECVPRVKAKTGAELSDQDLRDIQQYLVDGAADSEQPLTCG